MMVRLIGRTLTAGVLALASGAASMALAQSPSINGDTFTAGTTGALARLCGANAQEAAYAAAIHFCHGLLVGSGQTSDMMHKRQGTRPGFCLPTPSPTLDQVAARFVAWPAANPQFDGTRAADGLMRFAAAQYPCNAASARR